MIFFIIIIFCNMQKEGSEWGEQHCAVSSVLHLLQWLYCREQRPMSLVQLIGTLIKLDKETQTVNFSAFFCCFDVTNSKCPVPKTKWEQS